MARGAGLLRDQLNERTLLSLAQTNESLRTADSSSPVIAVMQPAHALLANHRPLFQRACPCGSSKLNAAESLMQEAPPWKAALCMAWSSTALGVPRSARGRGFDCHNFLTQLLSETSRACTIRVRRSTLGRLWNELGSHAGLHHRHRRSRTAAEERISGCGEPYPESPGQGPTASFGS